MKFKLVEDRLVELQKYKKRDMGPLRQFISSVLQFVEGETISGYDIHHLDGNNNDSSVTNIVLLPHNIHSKISGNKNTEEVKGLLLQYAIKPQVTIKGVSISIDEVNTLYAKLTSDEKRLTTV